MEILLRLSADQAKLLTDLINIVIETEWLKDNIYGAEKSLSVIYGNIKDEVNKENSRQLWVNKSSRKKSKV